MPEWMKEIVAGWPMIRANIPTFIVILVLITGCVWAAMNWGYGSLISNKDAEIKILERKVGQAATLPAPVKLSESAELRIHVYGDHRVPDRIGASNIWRWYFLQDFVQFLNQDGSKHSEQMSAKLFISFDNPVLVGTLTVKADKALPVHEVKEFNNRFAIIVFAGAVPECNVTISVVQ